jgi:hypothetical protein
MRKELKLSDLSLRVKLSDQTLVVRPTKHLVNSFHTLSKIDETANPQKVNLPKI